MKGELFQGADLRRMPLSAGGVLGAGPWQVEAVWRWEAATKSPRSLHGAGLWCCWMQTEASCRFPWVPLGFHPVFFSLVNICCDAGPSWQRCFWSPSPCKRLEALGAGPAQHPAGRPPPDAGWIWAALAILCQLPRLLLLPAICCSRLLRASPGGNSSRGSPLTVQDGTSTSSSQRGRR